VDEQTTVYDEMRSEVNKRTAEAIRRAAVRDSRRGAYDSSAGRYGREKLRRATQYGPLMLTARSNALGVELGGRPLRDEDLGKAFAQAFTGYRS